MKNLLKLSLFTFLLVNMNSVYSLEPLAVEQNAPMIIEQEVLPQDEVLMGPPVSLEPEVQTKIEAAVEEDVVKGDSKKPKKGKITLEDSYEKLTGYVDFVPDNRFIKTLDFTFNYQGNMEFKLPDSKTGLSSVYEMGTTEIGLTSGLSDGKTRIKMTYNLTRDVEGYNDFFEKVSDFYVTRKLFNDNYVTIGNSRVPLGMEGARSQFDLLTVEKSQIARNFSNYRAMGVKLHGSHGIMDYNLGMYDSTRYFDDPLKGVEFNTWVNARPLELLNGSAGTLVLGGGVSSGNRDGSYTVFGTALAYNYKKFLVNFEYSGANGSNAKRYNSDKAQGIYSTVAYHVHPKVQLVGKFDVYDPNLSKLNDIKTEYTAGVNYYLLDQKIKFVLNYIFATEEQKDPANKILLQTQFML